MAENVGEEIAKELAKQAYEDCGKAIVKPLGETGGLLECVSKIDPTA